MCGHNNSLEGVSVIDVSISHSETHKKAARPSLIVLLRDATREIHQLMHCHAGFCAIKDGTIRRRNYNDLLKRLYGFHAAFELQTGDGSDRTIWLTDDLLFLGETDLSLAAIPRCAALPELTTANQRLGAHYVIAGSALGGREMSRGLDHLLGDDMASGRRFFLGHGARTGEVWRQWLALLADAPCDPETQTEIVQAAVDTFSAFERWSAGWSA